jgi:hypothetical protein
MALATQVISNSLLRQRERTVDNVKRLYAFVLSLSFANFLREIVDTASGTLANPASHGAAFGMTMSLDVALLAVFLFTAIVYYFHADKFLDIRYAMPAPGVAKPGADNVVVVKWEARQFGWDCLTLILTVIPFAIMSYTLDKGLVGRFGIIPFYAAYIVLLQYSVVLIMLGGIWDRAGRVRRCLFANPTGPGDGATIDEERRHSALNLHWSLLDTVAVLILQRTFWIESKGGGLCGPGATHFMWLFLIVATLRNLLDYFAVWPFLYLSGDPTDGSDRRLLMRLLLRADLTARGGELTKLLTALLFAVSLWVTWRQLYSPLFDILSRCP